MTLQNTNGRETPEEMYKKGIEACYEELCEGKPEADTDGGLHLQNVNNRELLLKIERLEAENELLNFMVDNGLGEEDMMNDITYPPCEIWFLHGW